MTYYLHIKSNSVVCQNVKGYDLGLKGQVIDVHE